MFCAAEPKDTRSSDRCTISLGSSICAKFDETSLLGSHVRYESISIISNNNILTVTKMANSKILEHETFEIRA